MALRKSLYVLLLAVLSFGATRTAWAQEPVPGTQPQRVSGGVVEQPTVRQIADTLPRIRLQSSLFLDTMPLSRMSTYSIVVPGFSQLYNNQYWKIPVLYGSVGTLAYLGFDANKKFRKWRDYHEEQLNIYYGMDAGAEKTQYFTDHVSPANQLRIKYNTQRQVYLVGAAATYLYFMADGVLNYPHYATPVKKATTLAMIFPGAGQAYNKSYWKIPIVVGAFATMGYLIDWNSRGYNRMRTAYNLYPNNEFSGWGNPPSLTRLQSERDMFRRNRDLCIILTGALYLLSVVEAHVDAYMKDFDVSTDLAVRVEPTLLDMNGLNMASGRYHYPGAGLSMKITF